MCDAIGSIGGGDGLPPELIEDQACGGGACETAPIHAAGAGKIGGGDSPAGGADAGGARPRDLLRHWKRHVRRAPPNQRLVWLENPAGEAAFAGDPDTRLELLRGLKKLRTALGLQACSEPWFREVWHYGGLYAPPCPCGCDDCRLRRLWPANHYVGSTGLSFECATEGRLSRWHLLPSSPSGHAIYALGQLTRTDPDTGQVRQGGKLQSPVRMLPESEAALRREIERFKATGRIAPDRSRVNIGPVAKAKGK